METERRTCTNPATGTVYRLVVSGTTWRITKSQAMGDSRRLAHLRGMCGADAPDRAAVDRLVSGTTGTTGVSDPLTTYAAVVVTDLDGTATVLTGVVRTATAVHDIGCPGFRAKSPVLRAQRQRAMATAIEQMQAMATMWAASGLPTPSTGLPDWLRAALEDNDATV